MSLSRSPRGINVRRYLEGLSIHVRRTSESRSNSRAPNVVFGRARTIARLLKSNEETLTTALRCIQASDPTSLQSDVILAVYRYIHAHKATEARPDAIRAFRAVRLGEIRDRVVGLARGQDGLAHAAKVEGIYFILADRLATFGEPANADR